MTLVEMGYLLFGGVSAAAGATMVGLSAKAYWQTGRREMFHLSIGFTLIVAAVVATLISGHLSGFAAPRVLLTVQYALTTIGFLFIVYSLITTRPRR